MKQLYKYLSEAITITPTLEYQIGTTDDFIDWGVWVPNDDISSKECNDIVTKFYKTYPVNHNDCGIVAGISVKCDHKYEGNGHWIEFTFYWGDASRKDRMKVIEEIANFLSNTVYSVVGGKKEIIDLLKNLRG